MILASKHETPWTDEGLLLGVLHNGGSLPGSASYTYGAAGNRLTKTAVQEASPNPVSVLSQYSYDPIYELTQAVVNGSVAEGYSYDAVGNRLTSAGPTSYNYNTSNELTSTSAATYAYDNNGNSTSKTDSTGTTSYTWDYENRLATVTLPGEGGTVYFNYDPFGRRIRKVYGGATTIYAYDGDNVLEELASSGSVVARYTQGAGIDEPLAMYRGLATSYFHADGLGSITSLTDGSGQLAASYVYDSFGKLTASTGIVTNPFQYTGRESDSETGLYYYRARYYDQNVGRLLSEDPIRAAWSAYDYVDNNPTNYIDSSGISKVKVCLNTMKLILTDNSGKPIFCPDVKAEGCSKTPTPIGRFTLGAWQPDKTSPRWGSGSSTPWSDSSIGYNVFGAFFAPVNGTGGVGIHGRLGNGPITESLFGLINPCSHGCIRLSNDDITRLHDLLPDSSGTAVTISNKCTGHECDGLKP